MKYLVSLSKALASVSDTLPSTIIFKLNRQIPSGSRVKLLQFNFNTGSFSADSSATVPARQTELDPETNGIMVCIDNLMTTNSFYNDSSSTQTHPILASIPLSTFFTDDKDVVVSAYGMKDIVRYRQRSYEPQYACSLDISSPISVFEISLRSNKDASLLDGDNLKHMSVTFLLEIEEDCDCKKNDY